MGACLAKNNSGDKHYRISHRQKHIVYLLDGQYGQSGPSYGQHDVDNTIIDWLCSVGDVVFYDNALYIIVAVTDDSLGSVKCYKLPENEQCLVILPTINDYELKAEYTLASSSIFPITYCPDIMNWPEYIKWLHEDWHSNNYGDKYKAVKEFIMQRDSMDITNIDNTD